MSIGESIRNAMAVNDTGTTSNTKLKPKNRKATGKANISTHKKTNVL